MKYTRKTLIDMIYVCETLSYFIDILEKLKDMIYVHETLNYMIYARET